MSEAVKSSISHLLPERLLAGSQTLEGGNSVYVTPPPTMHFVYSKIRTPSVAELQSQVSSSNTKCDTFLESSGLVGHDLMCKKWDCDIVRVWDCEIVSLWECEIAIVLLPLV